MANNYRRIPGSFDEQGFFTPGYSAWDCERCGGEVCRYYLQRDVDCPNCGACYNASGQRLRDDWRGNPSVYDDEIGDLEGFEIQHGGDW
ncbi:hypothetical protein MHAS_01179 [Mycolicibacterium hassiacum DSM 44199]|uniref:hypothetical protein n=1 Tax=Mycolicibacterium hassiacum TaxID=46351 RepID=UPI00035E4749|nr:hypothetical protein [Mycolicibacterium hassiacum]MDA4086027.1 hypothetical protein [Mycolicibacterium hassiacum DSM 44199]VCT89485.1 hypothetical protein MHAS_01179 [Mycolicibacterium hassiacum DSM 44199]